MFTYLCRAPKGSSPGLFYCPNIYIRFYPGRDKYIRKDQEQILQNSVEIVDDKGSDAAPMAEIHNP